MACGRWPGLANGGNSSTCWWPASARPGAPVTAGELGELRSLLEAMDMPGPSLAGLNVEG